MLCLLKIKFKNQKDYQSQRKRNTILLLAKQFQPMLILLAKRLPYKKGICSIVVQQLPVKLFWNWPIKSIVHGTTRKKIDLVKKIPWSEERRLWATTHDNTFCGPQLMIKNLLNTLQEQPKFLTFVTIPKNSDTSIMAIYEKFIFFSFWGV